MLMIHRGKADPDRQLFQVTADSDQNLGLFFRGGVIIHRRIGQCVVEIKQGDKIKADPISQIDFGFLKEFNGCLLLVK